MTNLPDPTLERRRFQLLLSATRGSLVQRIAKRLGPRLAASVDAEDILQQASMTAYARFARDRPRTRRGFVTWMLCIAEYEIKNTARRLAPRSRPRHDTALPPSMWGCLPDDPLVRARPGASPERREGFERSLESVAGLDDMQRVVLVLRDFLGLTLETASFVTGRSREATRSLHARARAALRG